MGERKIGIRELTSTPSECVRQVKSGRTLVVNEHGHPVAPSLLKRCPFASGLRP